MSTNDTYLNGVLRERADDTTRIVTTYGPTGQVTNTRPYTTAEDAAADARAAAGYTALLINPTETTTGSGTKLLIDAQVGGVSKFNITNAGAINTYGNINTRSAIPWADSTYTSGSSSNYWSVTYTDKIFFNATATIDGSTAGEIKGTGIFTADNIKRGTGFPEGVVTANVGTVYIDTAITNGVSSWIKKSGTGSTGWKVLEGDTGWRNLGQLWPQITENILLRRIGDVCYVTSQGEGLTIVSTVINNSRLMELGFKPSGRTELLITNNGSVVGRILAKQVEQSLFLTTNTTGTYNAMANSSYLTTNAWPTTLPGTAA